MSQDRDESESRLELANKYCKEFERLPAEELVRIIEAYTPSTTPRRRIWQIIRDYISPPPVTITEDLIRNTAARVVLASKEGRLGEFTKKEDLSYIM